jgi:hypothetical protein
MNPAYLSALLRNAWADARRDAARLGGSPRRYLPNRLREGWMLMRALGYVTRKARRGNMSAYQAALLAVEEMSARHRAEGVAGFLVGGVNKPDASEAYWRRAYPAAA